MLENTTVTLPLSDFDDLRESGENYRRMARRLANCFEYTCAENAEPQECENCQTDTDCNDCEIYENNPTFTETLTVDVERLIQVAKKYALYGKDVETELDEITVTALKP